MSGTKKAKKKAKKLAKNQIVVPKKTGFWSNKNYLIAAICVLTLTIIAFYPSLDNHVVNWDDDRNFYENDLVTSINGNNFWKNTKEIFQTGIIGNYNPLSIWTFALEKLTFGMDDYSPWHLNNLLLHLFCVFLVFRISVLLGLNATSALIVAALFGIHPMRVESVAWLTERKDVLYGAFYLSAIFYYLKYLIEGRKKRYIVFIIVLFTLSLFSKIQAVSLPLSFLAIDYLRGRKLEWKLIFEKWYLFLMSLGFGIFGVYMLRDFGSLENTVNYSLWQKLFVGSWSYLIYIVKSIIPFKMVPLYPYAPEMPAYFYPSMIMLPLTLWGLWKAHQKEWKHAVFGILFFTVNIIFLLQILGAGQGFLADRFTYIPYFGLFFLYGYLFQQLPNLFPKMKKAILPFAGIVLLIYAGVTYKQCGIWKNSDTLWTHVLKYNDNITLPFGNRANYYRDNGQPKKALLDYSQVIALDSNAPAPFNSRARLYFNSNNRDTLLLALTDYSRAIELNPNDAEYYANRGATYARLNQMNQALADLTKCLEINPNHTVGYLNRSVIYNNSGQTELALADITSYLKLNPYNSDLWYESARAKRMLNNPADALNDYNQAINLNAKGTYYYERAKTHSILGNKVQAIQDLVIAKKTVRVDPNIEAQIRGN